MPSILHYTWVGPPKIGVKDDDRPDIAGPIAMAASSPEPCGGIHFHCLKRYARDFDGTLSRHDIVVRPIEDTLGLGEQYAEHILDFSEVRTAEIANAKDVALDVAADCMMRRGLEPGASIRQIVSGKVMWNYYILAKEGGYALDTGISPKGPKPQLTEFANMMLPAACNADGEFETVLLKRHHRPAHPSMGGSCCTFLGLAQGASALVFPELGSVKQGEKGAHVDVWMIYAPPGDPAVVRCAETLFRFSAAWREDLGKPKDPIYLDYCRGAVINSALTGIYHSDPGGACVHDTDSRAHIEKFLWRAELFGEGAGLLDMPFKKRYFGSHRK